MLSVRGPECLGPRSHEGNHKQLQKGGARGATGPSPKEGLWSTKPARRGGENSHAEVRGGALLSSSSSWAILSFIYIVYMIDTIVG